MSRALGPFVALTLFGACQGVGELRPLTCPAEPLPSWFCPGTGGPGSTLDGGFDEVAIERTWGEFAAKLPITQCTTGDLLLVDSVDDTLEGGGSLSTRSAAGQTLSLREALVLAANTPGPHRINFDASVFPAGGGSVIHVTDDPLPLIIAVADTCIDARGRGVTVEFSYQGTCENNCGWGLGAGSQMTGLVIKGNSGAIIVSNALIAGNRFTINYLAIAVANGAQIGPWNVFGHGSYGVRLDFYFGLNPPLTRVTGNFFGVEPSTMADLDLGLAVTAFERLEFANNVSNAPFRALGSRGTVMNNRFLGSDQSYRLQMSGVGWQVGPGNIVEGSVYSRANHFFENSIEGDIITDGLIAPPEDAGVGLVFGACPATGTVEVSMRVAGAWSPVGSTQCTIGERWSFSSGELRAGLQAATLFTDADGGATGRYSAPVLIPSTP